MLRRIILDTQFESEKAYVDVLEALDQVCTALPSLTHSHAHSHSRTPALYYPVAIAEAAHRPLPLMVALAANANRESITDNRNGPLRADKPHLSDA